MLDLYRNIKKLRIENGWTQAELAQKVGYADKTMVSRIENGKIDLSQSQILAFANAFGVDPAELFGNDGLKSEITDSKPVNNGWYLDPETAAIAQELKDNPELRILFDAAKDVRPEDLKAMQVMVEALRRKERHED